MPKAAKSKTGKAARHNPLADQILEEEAAAGIRQTPRTKQRTRAKKAADDLEDEATSLPADVTKKVLKVAQEQKAEDGEDAFEFGPGQMTNGAPSEAGDLDMSDVEVDEEGFVNITGATAEEEAALSLFLPGGSSGSGQGAKTLDLASMIMQKIQDHDAKQQTKEAKEQAAAAGGGLSPKVVQVYTEIGKWLKNYKSGKIPKAFKVIPSLANWEEVLALTNPLAWSPAAMYEAVNIFASNLNPRMAQRFFNLVLLPAVRQNIAEHKRLNFHYFRSLKKALFKPAAFFKGILLPMAQESCTLREVCILSSVLGKASVPAMHVAATIVRLCVMSPWYGTTSVLLAAMLNKKYALPLQVIEQLVQHFCAFSGDDRALPVVWHRTLLVFVQRYKFDLSEDQRKQLKELLRIHLHEGIGPEIRRELLAPKPGELQAPGDVDMS